MSGSEGSEGRLTADGMRALFAERLTYADVTPNDVVALQGYLCVEYARHDREAKSRMRMRPTYRKRFEPRCETSEPRGQGHITSAYLFVSGYYFDGREAISFNPDDFIGFAGWADGRNVQPFLRAFRRWVTEWMGGAGHGAA